jgi:ZIP family zinc transporter
MSLALEAACWGCISEGALVLGSAVGYFCKVPGRVIAGGMAFGSEVLMSALSFELMEEAFQ